MDTNQTGTPIQVGGDQNLLHIAKTLKDSLEGAARLDLSTCSKEAVQQYVELLTPAVKTFSFQLMDIFQAGFKNPEY